jgi:hypothetical protein
MLLINVVGAVKRNKRLTNVSKAEVETVVKLWLRYAQDRSGGRQVRHSKAARSSAGCAESYSDIESD